MGMTNPTPGVYRKGLDVRVADTAADAVRLAFEGYAKQAPEAPEPVADEVDYRDLQKQAKELGIPANQAKADLAQAVAVASATSVGGVEGGPSLSAESPLEGADPELDEDSLLDGHDADFVEDEDFANGDD